MAEPYQATLDLGIPCCPVLAAEGVYPLQELVDRVNGVVRLCAQVAPARSVLHGDRVVTPPP